MTNEEIIQGLYRGDSKAIDMAIKALEQEPCEKCEVGNPCLYCEYDFTEKKTKESCEDAVSREAVKNMLTAEWTKYMPMESDVSLSFVLEKISELPSVTPKARWIPVSKRLPEICEKDCRGNITFSEAVLSTQIYGDGYAHVGIDQYTTNNGGGWLSEVPFDNPDECCKVIAWMPLPQPYLESEGN